MSQSSTNDAQPPRLFDTHTHLDQPEFDADRADVIRRAVQSGIERMLCVGITLASSREAVELAQRNDEVLAAVGIHPNNAAEAAAGDWDEVLRLAGNPRVVALGETGLDRHWDFAPFDLQRDYFDRHLRASQQLSLPVIIHCREAEADVMPMLREAAGRGPLRGVMHAFSGDETLIAECVALGLHVSFAGNVTYTNKKFQTLQTAARAAPLDRLLLETDCPYLVPTPHRGKQKRNEPALVVHTARQLAELRGEPFEQLAAATHQNAQRLFSRL